MICTVLRALVLVGYVSAQHCPPGSGKIGSNCVCYPSYICSNKHTHFGAEWGCAVTNGCGCSDTANPCTSFTTFPDSNESAYTCTPVRNRCNVPGRFNTPTLWNTPCAGGKHDQCISFLCAGTVSDFAYANFACPDSASRMCNGICDLHVSRTGLTAIVVVMTILLLCCVLAPTVVCFFTGAACFEYRNQSRNSATEPPALYVPETIPYPPYPVHMNPVLSFNPAFEESDAEHNTYYEYEKQPDHIYEPDINEKHPITHHV